MKYFIISILFVSYCSSVTTPSKCYGTSSNGKLVNGVQLPLKGNNFVSYSSLAHSLGRTYLHSEVKKIIVNTYKFLETEHPNKIYKYAEIGFKDGGPFKPHKTHQNGLSVDFMTPVVDSKGTSVHLPTHALNKFGYGIEFDIQGNYGNLRIDYNAMAAHIVTLHKQSKLSGHELWRVIFDPKLQRNLFSTKYGDYLRKYIRFSTKRSWVRHDEHYHIDFAVACKQSKPNKK